MSGLAVVKRLKGLRIQNGKTNIRSPQAYIPFGREMNV